MITVLFCVIICLFGAVAYYFADSKGKSRRIEDLSEQIGCYRSDLVTWQNKALYKHGNTPLGFETREKKEIEDKPQSKIVTRGELEARSREMPDDVVTVSGVNGRRKPFLDKAEEIINATK